ncbi:MAG TPA: phosphotransferase [Rhodothermales bacterium]|nr:phosphotransferase [Rhodothermales bacterium]
MPAPKGLETLLEANGEDHVSSLAAALPDYLKRQRWFGAKDQPIHRVVVRDALCLQAAPMPIFLAILCVDLPYRTEYYSMPLALACGKEAQALLRQYPHAALAWVDKEQPSKKLLYDAAVHPAFWLALWRWWQHDQPTPSRKGRYVPTLDATSHNTSIHTVRLLSGEQSNSSALLGDAFYVKLYRRLAAGIHPETELLQHLTEVGFAFAPRLHGTITLRQPNASFALCILQQALDAETDGWTYARSMTMRFLHRVAGMAPPLPHPEATTVPAWLRDTAPEMLTMAHVLGERTAELHGALAKAQMPALRPLPGTLEDTHAFVERVREEIQITRQMLTAHADALPDVPAETTWEHGLTRLDQLASMNVTCQKIRVHGDYHLGQVVRLDGEFYLLDFEGEPVRSLAERRTRDCYLRDVAGMLRSLEYAAFSACQVHDQTNDPTLGDKTDQLLQWCQTTFLDAYYNTDVDPEFYAPPRARALLAWAYLVHKALYEVRYELSHRPDWTWIPLRGLRHLLEE